MKNEIKDLTDKEFIEQYIPFSELKKAGFFERSIRRKDHQKIVDRFLSYFGTTKRQYILNQPQYKVSSAPNSIEGNMPMKVNEDGEINRAGFHLSITESE